MKPSQGLNLAETRRQEPMWTAWKRLLTGLFLLNLGPPAQAKCLLQSESTLCGPPGWRLEASSDCWSSPLLSPVDCAKETWGSLSFTLEARASLHSVLPHASHPRHFSLRCCQAETVLPVPGSCGMECILLPAWH